VSARIITPSKRDVKSPKTRSQPGLLPTGPVSSQLTLPYSSRLILALLTLLSGERGVIDLSLRELSRTSRLSLAQVRRTLIRLQALGLIRWERSVGRGHRSRITLLARENPEGPLSPKEEDLDNPHPPAFSTKSCPREVIHSPKTEKREKSSSNQEKRNVSFSRPRVLGDMPRSCSVLFDILLEKAHDGLLEIPLLELCRLSGFTKLTVRRALRRLEAVRLIRREGGGRGRGRKTRIRLLWKRFSPEKGLPTRSNVSLGYPENGRNPSGGAPEVSAHLPKTGTALSERAHFWALGEIRRSLLSRPAIEPGRRAVIMACLGPAVYRAIRKGRVKTRSELEMLVGILEGRLEERRGLGLDIAATRRWAEWAVREALRQIEEERERLEASERLIRELLREREEVQRAWRELSEKGISFVAVFRRDNRGDEPEPRGEGEASLRAFELGAGLPKEVPIGRARGASSHVERGGAGGIPTRAETRPTEGTRTGQPGESLSFPGLYGKEGGLRRPDGQG